MEPKKFAVHNQTRDVALSPSVATVNAALEPLKVLKVLIEGLPANAKSGLWLTSFKGVPVARTLSPFDLVYLDKENQVILGVELSKDGEFTPPKGQPASALVLPPKSLSQSKTRAGDQLEFLPAAAEEPAPAAAAPVQAVPPESSLPAPEAAEPSPAQAPVPTAPPTVTPAPSPNFFASLLPQPAPAEESVAAASSIPAEAGPSSGPQTIDILRREEPAPSPFAFPDTPRSPLIRPAPEPAEPPAPSTSAPIHEPFWPKRAERSLISPSSAPIEEPQSSAENIPAAATPSAPAPIQEPPFPSAEPYPSHYQPPTKRKYPWKVKLLRWLFPDLVIKDATEEPHERRRADRQSLPGLIAYYFTGGSPEPQKIANISVLGFYLQTDERWMPGTIVRMTLQRLGSTGEDPSDTITVNSRIVRWGADGEGFEFILTDLED